MTVFPQTTRIFVFCYIILNTNISNNRGYLELSSIVYVNISHT